MDLPVEQRVEIVDRIMQTFNQIDPEIEQARTEEAARRLKKYKQGKVSSIPGEEAFKNLRDITDT